MPVTLFETRQKLVLPLSLFHDLLSCVVHLIYHFSVIFFSYTLVRSTFHMVTGEIYSNSYNIHKNNICLPQYIHVGIDYWETGVDALNSPWIPYNWEKSLNDSLPYVWGYTPAPLLFCLPFSCFNLLVFAFPHMFYSLSDKTQSMKLKDIVRVQENEQM